MDSGVGVCWVCEGGGKLWCSQCRLALYCSTHCQKKDVPRHIDECVSSSRRHVWCNYCGREDELGGMQCPGCLVVAYCSDSCRQMDLTSHQTVCLHAKTKVVEAAKKISGWKRRAKGIPQYIGRLIHALDYIRWSENEGARIQASQHGQKENTKPLKKNGRKSEKRNKDSGKNGKESEGGREEEEEEEELGKTEEALRLLLLGGDLKHVLCSLHNTPDNCTQSLEMTLVDPSAHILARDLLLLYLLMLPSDPTAHNHNHDHASKVVLVFYSVSLDMETHALLCNTLHNLLNLSHAAFLNETKGQITVDAATYRLVQSVWSGWMSFANDPAALQKLEKVRSAKQCGRAVREVLSRYVKSCPKQHQRALSEWVKRGSLDRSRGGDFPNVTLSCFSPLRPENLDKFDDVAPKWSEESEWLRDVSIEDEMVYAPHGMDIIFQDWDYYTVSRSVRHDLGLIEMYRLYLTRVFARARHQLLNSTRISLNFIQAYVHDLPTSTHLLKGKFDRIATGIYADLLGTPYILQHLGGMLREENMYAKLITHHRVWSLCLDFRGDQQAREACQKAKKTHRPPDPLLLLTGRWATFRHFLQAELLHHLNQQDGRELHPDNVPVFRNVRRSYHMLLSDYTRQLNHIVPFRFQAEKRPISMVDARLHTLEWRRLTRSRSSSTTLPKQTSLPCSPSSDIDPAAQYVDNLISLSKQSPKVSAKPNPVVTRDKKLSEEKTEPKENSKQQKKPKLQEKPKLLKEKPKQSEEKPKQPPEKIKQVQEKQKQPQEKTNEPEEKPSVVEKRPSRFNLRPRPRSLYVSSHPKSPILSPEIEFWQRPELFKEKSKKPSIRAYTEIPEGISRRIQQAFQSESKKEKVSAKSAPVTPEVPRKTMGIKEKASVFERGTASRSTYPESKKNVETVVPSTPVQKLISMFSRAFAPKDKDKDSRMGGRYRRSHSLHESRFPVLDQNDTRSFTNSLRINRGKNKSRKNFDIDESGLCTLPRRGRPHSVALSKFYVDDCEDEDTKTSMQDNETKDTAKEEGDKDDQTSQNTGKRSGSQEEGKKGDHTSGKPGKRSDHVAQNEGRKRDHTSPIRSLISTVTLSSSSPQPNKQTLKNSITIKRDELKLVNLRPGSPRLPSPVSPSPATDNMPLIDWPDHAPSPRIRPKFDKSNSPKNNPESSQTKPQPSQVPRANLKLNLPDSPITRYKAKQNEASTRQRHQKQSEGSGNRRSYPNSPRTSPITSPSIPLKAGMKKLVKVIPNQPEYEPPPLSASPIVTVRAATPDSDTGKTRTQRNGSPEPTATTTNNTTNLTTPTQLPTTIITSPTTETPTTPSPSEAQNDPLYSIFSPRPSPDPVRRKSSSKEMGRYATWGHPPKRKIIILEGTLSPQSSSVEFHRAMEETGDKSAAGKRRAATDKDSSTIKSFTLTYAPASPISSVPLTATTSAITKHAKTKASRISPSVPVKDIGTSSVSPKIDRGLRSPSTDTKTSPKPSSPSSFTPPHHKTPTLSISGDFADTSQSSENNYDPAVTFDTPESDSHGFQSTHASLISPGTPKSLTTPTSPVSLTSTHLTTPTTPSSLMSASTPASLMSPLTPGFLISQHDFTTPDFQPPVTSYAMTSSLTAADMEVSALLSHGEKFCPIQDADEEEESGKDCVTDEDYEKTVTSDQQEGLKLSPTLKGKQQDSSEGNEQQVKPKVSSKKQTDTNKNSSECSVSQDKSSTESPAGEVIEPRKQSVCKMVEHFAQRIQQQELKIPHKKDVSRRSSWNPEERKSPSKVEERSPSVNAANRASWPSKDTNRSWNSPDITHMQKDSIGKSVSPLPQSSDSLQERDCKTVQEQMTRGSSSRHPKEKHEEMIHEEEKLIIITHPEDEIDKLDYLSEVDYLSDEGRSLSPGSWWWDQKTPMRLSPIPVNQMVEDFSERIKAQSLPSSPRASRPNSIGTLIQQDFMRLYSGSPVEDSGAVSSRVSEGDYNEGIFHLSDDENGEKIKGNIPLTVITPVDVNESTIGELEGVRNRESEENIDINEAGVEERLHGKSVQEERRGEGEKIKSKRELCQEMKNGRGRNENKSEEEMKNEETSHTVEGNQAEAKVIQSKREVNEEEKEEGENRKRNKDTKPKTRTEKGSTDSLRLQFLQIITGTGAREKSLGDNERDIEESRIKTETMKNKGNGDKVDRGKESDKRGMMAKENEKESEDIDMDIYRNKSELQSTGRGREGKLKGESLNKFDGSDGEEYICKSVANDKRGVCEFEGSEGGGIQIEGGCGEVEVVQYTVQVETMGPEEGAVSMLADREGSGRHGDTQELYLSHLAPTNPSPGPHTSPRSSRGSSPLQTGDLDTLNPWIRTSRSGLDRITFRKLVKGESLDEDPSNVLEFSSSYQASTDDLQDTSTVEEAVEALTFLEDPASSMTSLEDSDEASGIYRGGKGMKLGDIKSSDCAGDSDDAGKHPFEKTVDNTSGASKGVGILPPHVSQKLTEHAARRSRDDQSISSAAPSTSRFPWVTLPRRKQHTSTREYRSSAFTLRERDVDSVLSENDDDEVSYGPLSFVQGPVSTKHGPVSSAHSPATVVGVVPKVRDANTRHLAPQRPVLRRRSPQRHDTSSENLSLSLKKLIGQDSPSEETVPSPNLSSGAEGTSFSLSTVTGVVKETVVNETGMWEANVGQKQEVNETYEEMKDSVVKYETGLDEESVKIKESVNLACDIKVDDAEVLGDGVVRPRAGVLKTTRDRSRESRRSLRVSWGDLPERDSSPSPSYTDDPPDERGYRVTQL